MIRISGLRALALLFLFGPTAAWAQSPASVDVGSLKVQVPSGWYTGAPQANADTESVVLASDPARGEQMVVLIQKVPKRDRALESMLTTTRNYVIVRMDGVIESTNKQAVAGSQAFTMQYTGESSGGENGRRTFRRTVIDRPDSFYVIQAVADPEVFSRHAGGVESLVKGLVWKK